jgi:hypothetical protein
MTGDRRRAGAARLIALIVMLLLCMWLLYRVFVTVPAAPPPKIKAADQNLYAKGDIRLRMTVESLPDLLSGRLNRDI